MIRIGAGFKKPWKYLIARVLKLKPVLGEAELVVVDPGEVLRGAVEEEAEVQRQDDDLANDVELETHLPAHVESLQLKGGVDIEMMLLLGLVGLSYASPTISFMNKETF